MRAAICTGPGSIGIRDVPTPSLDAGDVLVQVRNCGICGSDLHYYHGGFPPPKVCPGHEIAGEVVEAADSNIAIGTRVAIEPLITCGTCPYCRTGNYQVCPKFCTAGIAVDGGFADFIRMPAYALFPLPDTVDFEVGALAEPFTVAVHALRLAEIRAGDRVLVLGAGTIGLMNVAAAKAAGAGEIWITARYPHQETAAIALGATHVFRSPQAEERLAAEAQREPVDAVIETVGGTADTVHQSVQLVRPQGTVVVLGVFTADSRVSATTLVMKEARLVGSMTYGRYGTRADFETALAVLALDPERFRTLVTHRVSLDEIDKGFDTASKKATGCIKVTVAP